MYPELRLFISYFLQMFPGFPLLYFVILVNNDTKGDICAKPIPACISIFKVNNRNPSVVIVNFEHILHLNLVFLLLTLSR